MLAGLTLEQKVGQLFMLGFEGTTLNAANRRLIQDLHLGGVTVFARNVESGVQLRHLTAALQALANPVPLFISVDQEGGLVVRVTNGATVFPGNMALGASGDLGLARRVEQAAATELAGMGVNMNLAPVLDVNTNPLNPVIGVRSFGSDADRVSQFGVQTIQALQSQGVAAVAKHFPGHGDTHVDSHRDLPVVGHHLERLRAVEFKPFMAAIQAGVDGIMTAHVSVPAIEPRPDLPATLSKAVLTGVLRDTLRFEGLILTDALDMLAIKKHRSPAEAAVMAFGAGADMLLNAGVDDADDLAHAADGPALLLAAVKSGQISENRLDASVRRILEAKARRGILAPAALTDATALDRPEHGALALEAARGAVTLHRDNHGLLPLSGAQRVLVVASGDDQPTGLVQSIRRYAPLAFGASAHQSIDAATAADVIVLGTYDLAQDGAQQLLAAALAATGKPIIGLSLRGPYDAPAAPAIGTWLTVYGDRPVHLRAAAAALFGHLTPTGRVP